MGDDVYIRMGDSASDMYIRVIGIRKRNGYSCLYLHWLGKGCEGHGGLEDWAYWLIPLDREKVIK